MSKLPNAPLQEVIFEIRWALVPGKEVSQIIDDGFELASGRLSTAIEQDFPHYKRVVPVAVPDQIMHYQIIHQYWSGENVWPVIQLGPGIFTVNATEDSYEWNSFRDLIEKSLGWLSHAYKKSLDIQFASLRYIDAINVNDYGGVDAGWRHFIENNFNFQYNNLFDTRGNEKQIQINQVFELKDKSELQLQIANGLRNNEKTLIWQTAIMKRDPFNLRGLIEWIEEAHDVAHNLFREMIKPELYASFSKLTD